MVISPVGVTILPKGWGFGEIREKSTLQQAPGLTKERYKRGIFRSKLKNEQFPQVGAARRGKLIAHYTNEVLRLRGHLAYKPVEDTLRLIDLSSSRSTGFR